MVDAEGAGHFYDNVSMILDGHTNLEHNLPVATYYDDLLQLFKNSTHVEHADADRHFRRAVRRELYLPAPAAVEGKQGPHLSSPA